MRRLISYFLSNTSPNNCRNQMVYVKIIVSQRWDVVFETQHKWSSTKVIFAVLEL